MAAFCPARPPEIDPCAAPSRVRAEIAALGTRVSEIEDHASDATTLEAQIDAEAEIAAASERVFELRERFLRCDAIHARLMTSGDKLKLARAGLDAAVRTTYVAHLGTVTHELALLRSERGSFEQKLAAVTRLNDEILGDVLKLVQTQAFRASVTIEGVERPNEEEQAALQNALRGQREAIEALIAARPEFFGDASEKALTNKREELVRLDMMLGRHSRGKMHGIAFDKARAELKQSIVLIDNTLDHQEHVAHRRASQTLWYVFGLCFAVAVTILFTRRRAGTEQTFSTF
jgi:hypothetical protein